MNNYKSLSIIPDYEGPSSWWQHVPIAHFLTEILEPKIIVELGSHYGVSFFSFCEAAKNLNTKTFIYAVDTWSGDQQAGYYADDVYQKVCKHWKKYHRHRSQLLRTTFDEASSYFNEESIDILHIDGLHTYEAVSNDFKRWRSKVRTGGTILFHDTNVEENNFGVWKLWDEVKGLDEYQCMELKNGHGLGIATKGKSKPGICL